MTARVAAVVLVLALAIGQAAFALEKIDPTPLEFGARVQQVVASTDGKWLFLLAHAPEKGGPKRVLVWDRQAGKVDRELKRPKAPESMAAYGDKLVVACKESEVVAIVDATQLKIVRSVETEIRGQNVPPTRVVPDAPPGKAVVLCQQAGSAWWDVYVLEIDLATGKLQPLMKSGVQHAAFSRDTVVTQGNFGGSPSGSPDICPLSDLRAGTDPQRRVSRERPQTGREWHASFAPFRAANGGANLVTTDEQSKTILFSSDCRRELWTVDGQLLDVHPTRPLLLLAAFADQSAHELRELTLLGVHSGSSRRLWRVAVKLPRAMDRWVLRWGTAAVSLAPGQERDEVVFALGDLRGMAREADVTWYRAVLPSSAGSGEESSSAVEGEPPSEIRVGQTFEFLPRGKGGGTYRLKSGPEGMQVDPKTGRVTWTPNEAQLGKHDVLLARQVGQDETVVLTFTVRVRPK